MIHIPQEKEQQYNNTNITASGNPLDPMDFQFQNLNLQNSNSINDSVQSQSFLPNPVPLSRTTSLIDSMSMQRSSSPFSNTSSSTMNNNKQDLFMHTPPQVPIKLGSNPRTKSALFNTWTSQSNNVETTNSTPVNHPALLNQQINSTPTSLFNYPSNPNVGLRSSHSLLEDFSSNPGHPQSLQQPTSLPPGISNFIAQPPPVIITSQWKYKDMQGNVQGPFDTSLMSHWYASNYFQSGLQLLRIGTSFEPFNINDRYISLGDLINFVHNVGDPFTAFDQVATMANTQVNNNIHSSNSISSANNLPGQTQRVSNFFPVSINNPNTNVNVPTTSNQTSEKKTLANIVNEQRKALAPSANIDSTDYTFDEIFKLKFEDGSYYREVNVPIPVNRKHVRKMDSTTVIQPKELENYWEIKETDEYITKMQKFLSEEQENAKLKVIKNEMLKKESDLKAKEMMKKNEELSRQQKAEEMARKLLEEQERADQESKKREDLKSQKKQKKLKEQEERLLQQKKKEEQKLAQKQREEAEKLLEIALKIDPQNSKEDVPEVTIPKNNIAPWANKSNSITNIPTINLKQQVGLADKKLEEKQINEKQKAMKLNNLFFQEELEKESRKSVLTWANKPAAKQTPVTVDIKSQLMKKDAMTPTNTKSAAVNHSGDLEDPSFIEEQREIWEKLQRNSKSNSSSNNNNAWTTVSSKASTVKPSVTQKSNTKLVGSSTSIPSLKKVDTVSALAYPGNASISARQEFLKWCKSQMKLSPSVSINSVLEVLLSLPAGPEAKEIIADTIYSNSSVMDGRRFATEFIKKRVECERQVKDPLSWSEALALPEGNDDDWEFQVVSKKKGRKH